MELTQINSKSGSYKTFENSEERYVEREYFLNQKIKKVFSLIISNFAK